MINGLRSFHELFFFGIVNRLIVGPKSGFGIISGYYEVNERMNKHIHLLRQPCRKSVCIAKAEESDGFVCFDTRPSWAELKQFSLWTRERDEMNVLCQMEYKRSRFSSRMSSLFCISRAKLH